MRRSMGIVAGFLLAASLLWQDIPAQANSFHVGVVRPTTRSSSSILAARANARASNAVGNPYVNPNIAAGRHASQANASANVNAAEIRSAHVSVGTP